MAKTALAQHTPSAIHILLVEDESSDAFIICNMLESRPAPTHKVHHVRTQVEALAALAEYTFDVCLLDLRLPDANAFSALIDIQNAAPDVPVLILTGINDTTLARRAVGRGAQDYLLKDELETSLLSRAIDYAIERKRVEKELFQRANYDALTGLASRDMFKSRLQLALARAQRSASKTAILFIDLDRFKPINDAHGHDAGDEALKTVAQRIKTALRPYDTPARLGGDEFAVLLEDMISPRDAATIAQKILKTLSLPITYNGHSLTVGASIGIAFSKEAIEPEALLHHADIAMYHAKKAAGGYRFYAASMQQEAAEKLNLEEDLRTALAAEELQLYYQPYVSSESRSVIGVEALLRWQHPERGLLTANDFLFAAEAARIMPHIVRLICSQLTRDIAMWNAHALSPLHIAINLSASQLESPELLEYITPLAQADFLNGHRLAIELHEEAIATISGARFMTLAKLHEMGIALHLDHFGCSALPLTTLCALPFSLLKIDQALIKNMSDKVSNNMLISAAIMLAHHLGMKIGAVGVESAWQAKILKIQGCDVIQGFLTVGPLTGKQLIEWLQTSNPLAAQAS